MLSCVLWYQTLVMDLIGHSSYDIFGCLSVLFTIIIVAIVLESEYNSYNIIVIYTCKSFIIKIEPRTTI